MDSSAAVALSPGVIPLMWNQSAPAKTGVADGIGVVSSVMTLTRTRTFWRGLRR